jgi:hypothetical protein
LTIESRDVREGAVSFVLYLTVGETADSGWSSIPKGRFEMKRAVLLTVALVAAIAGARRLPAAPGQSDQVTHQPVGDASVSPAVVIRGFERGRLAGVSSDIGGARHWSANIRGVPTSLDFGTTVTVGGGTETGPVRALSSLEIREMRLPGTADAGHANEQDRFALTFTPRVHSPSYRL